VAGTLYVVATPLGNLGDLSPRAADTLKRVAVVAAEDTRHSKPLLTHAGSKAELVSFHAHSSERALERILRILSEGRDVALITDAGTPAISDPGVVLVAAARERGIPIVTIPGPNAVAASLSVSGIGADRYLFLGFLPRKGTDRHRLLDIISKSEWTTVVFESPNRVTQLLADLAEACGPERQAVVSRELTKVFEETRAGTLQDCQSTMQRPRCGERLQWWSQGQGSRTSRIGRPIPAYGRKSCWPRGCRAGMWLIDWRKKPGYHGTRRIGW